MNILDVNWKVREDTHELLKPHVEFVNYSNLYTPTYNHPLIPSSGDTKSTIGSHASHRIHESNIKVRKSNIIYLILELDILLYSTDDIILVERTLKNALARIAIISDIQDNGLIDRIDWIRLDMTYYKNLIINYFNSLDIPKKIKLEIKHNTNLLDIVNEFYNGVTDDKLNEIVRINNIVNISKIEGALWLT